MTGVKATLNIFFFMTTHMLKLISNKVAFNQAILQDEIFVNTHNLYYHCINKTKELISHLSYLRMNILSKFLHQFCAS